VNSPPTKPTAPIPQHLKDKVRQHQAQLNQQRFQKFFTSWTSSNEVKFSAWSQSKKAGRYHDVGKGICEGMSLDWLRRSLHGRRNFVEAEKYRDPGSDAMRKLEQKHKTIHSMYKVHRGKNTQETMADLSSTEVGFKKGSDPIAPFAASYNTERRKGKSFFKWLSPRTSSTSGFENLSQFQQTDAEWSTLLQTGECVAQGILTQLDVAEQLDVPFGLLISFELAGKGHTTAFYYDDDDACSPWHYCFLDPNLGQWRFSTARKFAQFMCELWRAAYSDLVYMTVEIICFDGE
jgi:hypothetical protein